MLKRCWIKVQTKSNYLQHRFNIFQHLPTLLHQMSNKCWTQTTDGTSFDDTRLGLSSDSIYKLFWQVQGSFKVHVNPKIQVYLDFEAIYLFIYLFIIFLKRKVHFRPKQQSTPCDVSGENSHTQKAPVLKTFQLRNKVVPAMIYTRVKARRIEQISRKLGQGFEPERLLWQFLSRSVEIVKSNRMNSLFLVTRVFLLSVSQVHGHL